MNEQEPAGAWFVYTLDWNAIPKALFDDELLARRWAAKNYGEVVFWPYGQEFDEVDR